MKNEYYEVDIHRLGCRWGTMPFGKLRGAWERYCKGRKFETPGEAVEALSDMWYDLESDDVRAEMSEDISYAESERILDKEYKRIRESFRFTWFYSYDDGECRIVRE